MVVVGDVASFDNVKFVGDDGVTPLVVRDLL